MIHPDLKQLFEKYSDYIYRICLRYVKDTQEAEDLSQEVFLKINENLNKFRTEAKVSTWIYKITINKCIDHLRTRNRQKELTQEHLHPLVKENLSFIIEDQVLTSIDIKKILSPLNPRVRKTLFLVLAEGMSHEEAGVITGYSKAAVAKIVKRFITKMKAKKHLKMQCFLALCLSFQTWEFYRICFLG